MQLGIIDLATEKTVTFSPFIPAHVSFEALYFGRTAEPSCMWEWARPCSCST